MRVELRVFATLIAILLPFIGFAQTPVQKPKPVYVSEDGEIYVKSGQDIYLRLAISPDDTAQSYILKSEATEKGSKAEPFHFEGHGTHTIRHMADHRIPQKRKENHLFYVHDDGKPPRIKVSVTKAPWVYNGNVNIYGKPVTITLNTKDADSGIFGTYASLNSKVFSEYQQPIQLTQEMEYTLKFYAMDNVGNESKQRMRLYALDFTPPTTTHKIIGGFVNVAGEDVVSPKSKISLDSRDARAGVKDIRYRFKDKRAVYKKGSLLTMNGLKDGTHSLVYAANDRVGNAEDNKTFTFYLDSIPPVVSYSLLGDRYIKGDTTFVSGFTTVELTATDNKAGLRRIRYYFPGNKAYTYDSPFSFPKRNGKFNFSYASSDRVINVSETVYKSVVVDISPPKVTPKFKGEHYFSRETHYVRLSTEISLMTTDNLSGVKHMSYAIDPSTDTVPGVAFEKPFTLPTEGEHKLAFEATDNVNNKSKRDNVKLFVDERSPEIYHHFSVNPTVPIENIYPLKSLLYLAATDKQSGIREIYYTINGGEKIKYKKPLSFSKKTDYLVEIQAIDNVGNESSSRVSFTIQ